jgi:hypothetical protein
MNEGREVWSTGSSAEKSASLNKSLRTTLNNVHQPGILFPKKKEPTEVEIVEKELADAWTEVQKRRRSGSDPRRSPSTIEKADADDAAVVEGLNSVEKALQVSGFDKLPMTKRARQALHDALDNGAEPVTQYTGKVMCDRDLPETPPAALIVAPLMEKAGVLDRPREADDRSAGPRSLQVGDRVVPLQWVDVGPFGAKFDLPFVPPVARVKKLHVAPATVTKDAYPPGRVPADMSAVERVEEQRLWAIELEPEGENKEASDATCPFFTKDTTMVLRLEPLAQPSGEV